MKFSISDALLILLAFQSMALSLFLFFTPRGKKVSNVFIGIFFLAIAAQIILYYLRFFDWDTTRFSFAIGVIYGPSFYLYLLSLLNGPKSLSNKHFFHFLLPLTTFFCYPLFGQNVMLFEVLMGVALLTYLCYSIFYLKRYLKRVKQTEAKLESLSISWLKSILYPLFFLAMIDIPEALHSYGNVGSNISNIYFYIQTITFLLVVNYFIFYGATRSLVFMGVNETNSVDLKDQNDGLSSFSIEELEDCENRIIRALDVDKIYMDPDLNLESFSIHIEFNSRVISRTISQLMETNFSDLINRYRLEHAKELLRKMNNNEMNIVECCFESGFNSKSNFYKYFKLKTGISPKEFRKRNQV